MRIRGEWFPISAVEGIAITDLMKTATDQYGSLARKRFAEDLPQLLVAAGHIPGWSVTLTIDKGLGKDLVEYAEEMTEEKREAAREFGKK